ncbi:MAG: DUF2062 domain-containing protein [Cyanobacteria bacterium LVE1205-1]
MKRWHRLWHYGYLRLLRLRSTPELISRGFAFGVFWGMFPLPGLQMAVAVLTTVILGGNKLSAAAGTWLSNPATTLPFTAMNYYTGQWVLGKEWNEFPTDAFSSVNHFLSLGQDVISSYLVGCMITGGIAGVISYLLGVPLLTIALKRSPVGSSKRRPRNNRR